jgi:hypothetical protein
VLTNITLVFAVGDNIDEKNAINIEDSQNVKDAVSTSDSIYVEPKNDADIVSTNKVNDTQSTDTPIVFKDVLKEHFAFNAVNWMYENGLILGYPDSTFKPNNPITKEEFSAILINTFVLDMSNLPNAPTYLDVSPDRWSYDSIEKTKAYLTNPKNIDSDWFFSKRRNSKRRCNVFNYKST